MRVSFITADSKFIFSLRASITSFNVAAPSFDLDVGKQMGHFKSYDTLQLPVLYAPTDI
jgi:hypothetical protein